MLVTRRNQDFMPTLFNELMNWNDTTYSTPRMNIMETKDNYKLELCIPGLTKEDVKLSIDAEGNLVVEMVKENKSEKKENKEEMRYLRHEFSVEHFRQTVMLPEDIHKEQISAKVENGILDIVIPKVTVDEKKQAVQTIEVC
ncbi:MAG: Hsp20/alpha crystallin family protein [Bacteroidales bacterium]|nr:Hsp20/alpha crystallin family protein [Bacteroidales bacterium]